MLSYVFFASFVVIDAVIVLLALTRRCIVTMLTFYFAGCNQAHQTRYPRPSSEPSFKDLQRDIHLTGIAASQHC